MEDLDSVLSGGVGKDGIPAIKAPEFVSVSEASVNIENEFQGIFLEVNGKKKFYPYNILVWHEIVLDEIGGEDVLVTFCPLCGSAIVYDRRVDGEILDFGVSGLLYESNLLMFDRGTESLWSQIEGRAVVGEYVDTDLKVIDSQLLTFLEVKINHPDADVLSTNTGVNRDYSFYPYGDYDTNQDKFLFPVTYKGEDIKIDPKDIVYASRVDGEIPVAFVLDNLKERKEGALVVDGKQITVEYKNGEVNIIDSNGVKLPGYYTMWFSWANHNLSSGVNEDMNGAVWIN